MYVFEYFELVGYAEPCIIHDMGIHYFNASGYSAGRMVFLVQENGLYHDVCWAIAH